MEWRDEAVILGTRRHGETSAILEVMSRAHGRHLGLVRGGRSRRRLPVLQPGNHVEIVWRARLDEHLGTFQVEPLTLHAGRLFDSAVAVYGLQTLAAHLRLLPERDPHAALFETLLVMLDHLEDPAAAAELVVRFELRPAGGARLRAGPLSLRRHRQPRRPGLRLPQIRPRRVARRRRSVGRAPAGAARLPDRRRRQPRRRAGRARSRPSG